MSVDVTGTMYRPFSLNALVEAAREILVELLGVESAPSIEVFADRRYQEGRRIDAGRRLTRRELAAEVIGDHVPGPLYQRPAFHFEFEVPLTGDGAWLMVIDLSERAADPVEAVFSPYRTCVGVVLATALALAAAEQGGGEFVDDEIRRLEPPVTRPRQMIEQTRLPDAGGDFSARCERYLRRFPLLDGWPRTVSMAHSMAH